MCQTIGNLFRLAIVGGSLAALALQFAVMFSCEFIVFGDENKASLGPWKYGTDGECNPEDFAEGVNEWVSGGWVSGVRGCMIVSMFCGAAACTMVTFEWLFCEVCCAGILEGLAFAGAWITGSFAFGMYGIDACQESDTFSGDLSAWLGTDVGNTECKWGPGATYNLIAVILYFGCGFLLCCAPQPDPICKK